MREIKFRMWSKSYKKMFDNNSLVVMYKIMAMVTKENVPAVNESEVELPETGISLPFQDDAILMQFTGMKDKNCKEIYEGDILTDGDTDVKVLYSLKYGGYIVVQLDDEEDENTLVDFLCYDDTVIIGNIYENPELLDVKK